MFYDVFGCFNVCRLFCSGCSVLNCCSRLVWNVCKLFSVALMCLGCFRFFRLDVVVFVSLRLSSLFS